MKKKKVIYNKVIHDVLNKLIEFNPNKDALENTTNDVFRVVFNLKDNQEQTTKEALLEEKSKENIRNEVKSSQNHLENSIQGNNSAPAPDRQEVKPIVKDDKSLRFVLETYINEHTDLETKIAYLKRFASPELLKNVEEELRKKEHDQYVYMIQSAEEIQKEEYIEQNHHTLKHKDNVHPDEDDFKGLDGIDELFKDFDHEKDDHIEHIQKNLGSTPQNIKPLISLIKEFKNIIENSPNFQDKFGTINNQEKTNNVHQNKFVQLLYDKYMNSNPIEQKDLLKALDNLHLKLEMKKNEILNKQKIIQTVPKQNLSR